MGKPINNVTLKMLQNYIKKSDIDRFLLDLEYPVGGNKPYVQFPGMPTPAEKYAGTSWEIDTKYQGRVLIGSGGDYAFGSTGGEEKHAMTQEELFRHGHKNNNALGWYPRTSEYLIDPELWSQVEVGEYQQDPKGGAYFTDRLKPNMASDTGPTGDSQPFNIMQPYIVVNFWKRIA